MTGQSVAPVELEFPEGTAGWLRAHTADHDDEPDMAAAEVAA